MQVQSTASAAGTQRHQRVPSTKFFWYCEANFVSKIRVKFFGTRTFFKDQKGPLIIFYSVARKIFFDTFSRAHQKFCARPMVNARNFRKHQEPGPAKNYFYHDRFYRRKMSFADVKHFGTFFQQRGLRI